MTTLKLSEYTDEQILEIAAKAKAGEKKAIDLFYKLLAPFSRRIANALLYKFSTSEISIIEHTTGLQNKVFMDILSNKEFSITNKLQIYGFIRVALPRYVENVNKKAHKDKATKSTKVDITDDDIIESVGQVEENIDQVIDLMRKIERIEKDMPKQAQAFTLTYIENYSNEEAAQEMGVSEKTVRNYRIEVMDMLDL